MPATKVGKIQASRYKRASNGQIIKSKQSNTDRCIDYINDSKGDKVLENDLRRIKDDIASTIDNSKEFLINYAFNKHKCYDNDTDTMLRTALNCSSIDNAKAEFKADEKAYYEHKIEPGHCANINKAFHIINSFKDHSVPAAKCQAIGEEFARRLIGNDFRAVVSTHTNTDHYHNHIVINAYSLNGPYKFRDSWNLGLKLQRISNELALENGIEIITEHMTGNSFELDENKLTFSNIRDQKMATRRHGSYKKQIMSDIILTAKNSTNWDEYYDQMTKKGYQIKHNLKSWTYTHDKYGTIRDNRLGYQFTKPFIDSFFTEKQELKEIENNKISINIKYLYVPKYEGTGIHKTRIPAILRLIMYLIKIFKEILNKNTNFYQNSILFLKNNIKKIENQLKNLLKIENLLKKYQINNFSALKIKKNQILKDYVLLNNTHKSMTTSIKKLKEITNAISVFNRYRDIINNIGISDSELNIYEFGTANILENKASINPITPRTKSRLYKALNNSGYVLKYRYSQLTERQAKDICYFLSKTTDNPMPDTLYTLKEYMSLKRANKLPVLKRTPNENNLKTIDFDTLCDKYNIHQQDREYYQIIIKDYKKAALKLKSYGLNTDDEINQFKEDTIDTITNNYDNINNKLIELKSILKDLSNIESFYTGTYENIYKPLKMLSEYDIVSDNIKSYLKDNDSILEQMICLRDSLQTIDLSVLDDENVIIAPIDILTAAQIALMLEGKDKSIDELLKLNKTELKTILTDFINKYDLNELINSELEIEKLSINSEEKQKTYNKQKDNYHDQDLDDFSK